MKAPEWLLFWTQRAFWMDGAWMNRSRSCVWVLIVWKENYSPLPPNSRPRACSFVRGRRWKKQAPVLLSFLSPSSSSSSSSSDKEIFHGRERKLLSPTFAKITSNYINYNCSRCEGVRERLNFHPKIDARDDSKNRRKKKNWQNTNTDAGEILVKDSMSTAQSSTHGMAEGMPKSGFFKYSSVVVDWILQSGWWMAIQL